MADGDVLAKLWGAEGFGVWGLYGLGEGLGIGVWVLFGARVSDLLGGLELKLLSC